MTPATRLLLALLPLALAAGCAATRALDEANALARAGAHAEALQRLEQGLLEKPDDGSLRAARERQRDRVTQQWLAQADVARGNGRLADAQVLLAQAQALQPQHPRVIDLQREIERAQRHEQRLADARRLFAAGRPDQAEAALREVVAEAPGHPAAAALLRQMAERAPRDVPPTAMAAAFQRTVSLEFRDAPLRQVFETLARSAGVNFVFDKDVRGDSRVTVFLRDVTLDEALRVILTTQQLDRRLLNESTVLVYPNTQGKQREHQELVTRSLFLTNADPKQALSMVRTLAKTRDAYVDERLNLLIVRDTPEVVRLVERLVASIDLPEPEVTMEVQVLEVATNRLDALGLGWPSSIAYGLPNFSGDVTRTDADNFRSFIANPALRATLSSNTGNANLLANPTIRARNHEKARVHIGDKLPVFTSTATANVGVTSSVSYLDVGLKLDIEPSVQLDNEVILKVGLEVSSVVKEVREPTSRSLAYQIGTRLTSTSLRLRDGETQVLAGLISDEDRRLADGLPGLADLPVVGRLFGVQTDTRNKTEVVMLITPRIVRNLPLPDAHLTQLAAGTDALPGAQTLRLRPQAKAGMTAPGGGAAVASRVEAGAAEAPAASASAPAKDTAGALQLSASATGNIGGTVSVTLANRAPHGVRGELEFDATRLRPAQPVGGAPPGRVPFELAAGADFVLVLRVLPAAAGSTVGITVGGVSATEDGPAGDLRVEGDAQIAIAAGAPP